MIKTEDKMKTRNIFGIFLVSILGIMNSCTPELGDMSAYDEWLGKEFISGYVGKSGILEGRIFCS